MAGEKLNAGDFGDEVAHLHEQLTGAGFEVSAEEVKRKFFGPATRAAVAECQRCNQMEVTGHLDEATAAVLSAGVRDVSEAGATPPTVQVGTYDGNMAPAHVGGAATAGTPFVITGTVGRGDGDQTAAGFRVVAYDRDMPSLERLRGGPQILGEATIDDEERFTIEFESATFAAKEGERRSRTPPQLDTAQHADRDGCPSTAFTRTARGRSRTRGVSAQNPNVSFRAYDRAGRELIIRAVVAQGYESGPEQILFNVPNPLDVVLRLEIPQHELVNDGRSEYEKLSDSLRSVLADHSPADLTDEDLQFLASRMGWVTQDERNLLALLRTSHLLAIASGVPAAAFYGWRRVGVLELDSDVPPIENAERREEFLKARLNGLACLEYDLLEEALLRAVAENFIPSSTNAQAVNPADVIRRLSWPRVTRHIHLVSDSNHMPLAGYTVHVLESGGRHIAQVVTNAVGAFELGYDVDPRSLADAEALRLVVSGPDLTQPIEVLAEVTYTPTADADRANEGATVVVEVPLPVFDPTMQDLATSGYIPELAVAVDQLAAAGIVRLSDIRCRSGVGDIPELTILDSGPVRKLAAHTDLARLTADLAESATLLAQGYESVSAVSDVPKEQFVTAVAEPKTAQDTGAGELGITPDRARKLHAAARSQTSLLDLLAAGEAAERASGVVPTLLLSSMPAGIVGLDNRDITVPARLSRRTDEATSSWGCSDYESAASPGAYLATLLDYAVKHVQSGKNPLTIMELARRFHQPLGELPLDADSAERTTSQVRIAIEVLRGYLGDRPLAETSRETELAAGEAEYLFRAYTGLLTEVGTTYDEVRRARTAPENVRKAIAERLGLTLTTTPTGMPRNDELDQLFRDPEAHDNDETILTEEVLERYFGLQRTTGDPLTIGSKYGDTAGQLVRWRFSGAVPGRNTDPHGVIHLAIAKHGSLYRASAYADNTRKYLVASGTRSTPVGQVRLTPSDRSGLSGVVDLSYTAHADDISIRVAPRLLSWRLRQLRASWIKADHPEATPPAAEEEYASPVVPIVDPQTIGADDLRAAQSGKPVYDLWAARANSLALWRQDLQLLVVGPSPDLSALEKAIGTALTMPGQIVQASKLRELAKVQDKGEVIEPQILQLGLTPAAFGFLMNQVKLADDGKPIAKNDWEAICDLLVVARKNRHFAAWRVQEKSKSISLSPDYFQVGPIERAPEAARRLDVPLWMSTRQSRQSWVEVLQARIEQETALSAGIESACNVTEDAALPLLRDVLIRAAGDNSLWLRERADWLTRRLLIDMRVSESYRTTRVAQAIQTMQELLFRLRTGQFASSTPESVASVQAVRLPDGRTHLLASDAGGGLWMQVLSGSDWGRWQYCGTLPGATDLDRASGVAAVAQEGGFNIAVVGGDHALWLRRYRHAWQTWEKVPSEVAMLGDPALVALDDTALQLFARVEHAGQTMIVFQVWDGTSWTVPSELFPSPSSAPAVVGKQASIHMIQEEDALGPSLGYARYDGDAWTSDSPGDSTFRLSYPALVMSTPDRLELVDNHSGHMWHRSVKISAAANDWLPWIDLDASANPSDPPLYGKPTLVAFSGQAGVEGRVYAIRGTDDNNSVSYLSFTVTAGHTVWSSSNPVPGLVPSLTLQAEDFDNEWKWLGSYATWRAAVAVLMYPDNLLLPSLESRHTRAFGDLVTAARPSRRIKPEDADELARHYGDYLQDVRDLRVEATCEASDLRESAPSGATLQHLFALTYSGGTPTGKVYWSTFDPRAVDPEYAQSFWKSVDLDTPIYRIVGATPWEQSAEGQHHIYLFLMIEDDSTWTLKRARFDLKKHAWEAGTVDIAGPLPPGWNGAPVAWRSVTVRVVQTSRYETPRLALHLDQVNGWDSYIRPLNPAGNGFAQSPGDWNDYWILPYYGGTVGGAKARRLHAALRTGNIDWIVYDTGPDLYIYANIPSGKATLIGSFPHYPDGFRGALVGFTSPNITAFPSSVYVFINHGGTTSYLKYSTAAGSLTTAPAVSVSGFDKEQMVSPHSGSPWKKFFTSGRFTYILKDVVGEELPFKKVQILPVLWPWFGPPAVSLSVTSSQGRRADIRQVYENNAEAPGAVLTYLREAFRLVPQQLGLALQASGEYVAALDWFCSVYDYRAPVADRYIDHGLVLDATLSASSVLENPEGWLLDPLNPHALARGRRGSSARYAVATLVKCLNDFADAEFTVDTSESLPRVRALCNSALELCDTAGFHSTDDYSAATEDGVFSTPVELVKATATHRQRVHEALLSDAAVERAIQHAGAAGIGVARGVGAGSAVPAIFSILLYQFCIPPNPVTRELRRHAELNLRKLRAGRNIAGVRRTVPIYSAPTDTQTGVSVTSNGQLSLPAPRPMAYSVYRYSVLIARAKELGQQAAQIEALFLAASEKRDEAAYRLFQARQEVGLAAAHVRLRDLQVSEALKEVALTQLQTQRTLIQLHTYRTWISRGPNGHERTMLRQYAVLADAERRLADATATFQQMQTLASGTGMQALFSGQFAYTLPMYAASFRIAGFTREAVTAQEAIQRSSFLASHERQVNEWYLQGQLAAHDFEIGKQAEMVALDRVAVTAQEKLIAETVESQARDTLEFLGNQFHGFELYDWMTGVLSDVYRSLLQHAAATLNIAYWKLAFERQEVPPVSIRGDYWTAPPDSSVGHPAPAAENERRGLTGSARLFADLYQLDQYAFESNRRKLALTKTISLAQHAPTEFHALRRTGVLVFTTPMQLFDRDFPGHYLRLIQRVSVSVVGLIPPVEGIKATLTSRGISTVVVGPTPFRAVTITQRPETVGLTLPFGGAGVFEDEEGQSGEMYLPFEGTGVDTTWEFRMPMAANPWDYQTLADVLFTVEYQALSDEDYRHTVIERLDRNVQADRVISLRNDYPDAWYDLANPEQLAEEHRFMVRLTIDRHDFPVNHAHLKLQHIALRLLSENKLVQTWTVNSLSRTDANGQHTAGPAGPAIDGVISTRRGNGEVWRQALISASAGAAPPTPVGTWELSLRSDDAGALGEFEKALKAGQLEDILLVLSYAGETPAWIESET